MIDIMIAISKFLSCNIITYDGIKDKIILSVSVESINKNGLLLDYFNKYPLYGIKNKNYIDWVRAYNMIINKQHFTVQGRDKIRHIKSNMYSKRTDNIESNFSYIF